MDWYKEDRVKKAVDIQLAPGEVVICQMDWEAFADPNQAFLFLANISLGYQSVRFVHLEDFYRGRETTETYTWLVGVPKENSESL